MDLHSTLKRRKPLTSARMGSLCPEPTPKATIKYFCPEPFFPGTEHLPPFSATAVSPSQLFQLLQHGCSLGSRKAELTQQAEAAFSVQFTRTQHPLAGVHRLCTLTSFASHESGGNMASLGFN